MFHPNDVLEFSVMGATTLVLLVSLTWLGSGRWYRQAAAAVIALLTSVPQAFITHAVFRA
jgi:putative flippase GtrA